MPTRDTKVAFDPPHPGPGPGRHSSLPCRWPSHQGQAWAPSHQDPKSQTCPHWQSSPNKAPGPPNPQSFRASTHTHTNWEAPPYNTHRSHHWPPRDSGTGPTSPEIHQTPIATTTATATSPKARVVKACPPQRLCEEDNNWGQDVLKFFVDFFCTSRYFLYGNVV